MQGHRLVAWGWAAAAGLSLMAIAFAGDVEGRFADGAIKIRPWMQRYNLILGLAHAAALSLMALGGLRIGRRWAFVSLSLATAAVMALLLFPAGPFAPDGNGTRALRILVFAPSVLRSLGCLALAFE